ncbi:glutathione S-transferase family protein [Asticcacaulis sp. EMRT-3]|uniref:glutathione S-transferase family protein n=1 Tax=Asticcacaulis sp. EMRT-3 TaxID=3040349 RepID=UPI0024AEBFA6|nr:glutathione S-transferase family protein [Asticcacaulis sp. EMRT-3]MDI7776195.1 glutathione S-transferase family protein [Asticcacaulis sp. EMRT-3]
MYELHIGNKNYSSWSLRPWVLLTALGLPFNEHQHFFTPDNSAFRSFSPTALVPCLVDGQVTVWDSLAIAEYVAEDHPQVWPKNRTARAFARSAAAEMHSGFSALRNLCSMSVGVRIKLFDTPPALIRDLARIDDIWRTGLSQFGGPYLAGGVFTAIDAFYAPVVFRIQTYGVGFDLSREARAYIDRMLAEPAMQTWYQAGLAETERDAPHEAEIIASGEMIADYRAV